MLRWSPPAAAEDSVHPPRAVLCSIDSARASHSLTRAFSSATPSSVLVAMSKVPLSVAQRNKPTSAGGKKDAKKPAEDEQQPAAPPPTPALTPFDLLPDVWALSSVQQQRRRISALFNVADCPAGCLCFARVALDDTVQHVRFLSTLALSPAQSRFVYQLIATVLSQLQRPASHCSFAALRERVKLLLTTNCTELLPATTYIDTTHLLASLDLPPLALPAATPSDGSSSSAALSGAALTPAGSRPSTAAGKRPPPSTRNKPVAPPSPQQQPIKASKALSAKEKEAAAAAEKAAAVAAAEAAAAEAAALAALPAAPLAPPAHFLPLPAMERVWRYVAQRLLRHAELYRDVYDAEARRRREEEARTEFVWRRVKQQPDGSWLQPLQTALSERSVSVLPLPVALEEAAELVDCALPLQEGEYSAEERDYLLQAKAAMEQQLREAASQQRQQQQQSTTSKADEEKQQHSARSEMNVGSAVAAY